MENGLKIEDHVVVSCDPIYFRGEIPAGVTGIAPRAFLGTMVCEVKFPPGLREVGEEAFLGCQCLREAVFPSGLERLGARAFSSCDILARVVLPETLREMATDVFFSCISLRKVELSPDNPFWCQDGDLLWKRDCTALIWVRGSYARSCRVPDGISTIPPDCFDNSSLEELSLPDSVVELGADALTSCYNLESLRLPARLRRIEKRAFAFCENLRELVLPETLEELGDCALEHTALEECVLPASLRILGTNVFRDTKLRRLEIRGELPEEWKTFSLNRLGLQDVDSLELQADRIPMEKISRGSLGPVLLNFARRRSAGEPIPEETRRDRLDFIRRRQKFLRRYPLLQDILLDEKLVGVKDIDGFLAEALEADNPELTARLLDYQEKHIDRAEKARLEEKKLKRELEALSRTEPTLRELKRLWPGRVLDDGSWEIRGCGVVPVSAEPVRELTVPASLKKTPVSALAAYAFSPEGPGRRRPMKAYLNSLWRVQVPSGIRTLGDHVFAGCVFLREVQLPPELEELPEGTFENCVSLLDLELPAALKRIRADCFRGCAALEQVTLPEGLEELEEGAFAGCRKLKCVRFPRSLRTIGPEAFRGCQSLKRVELPASLEELGDGAFAACRNLEVVSFPAGLRRVGKGAFEVCDRLKEADLSGTRVSLEEGAFRGCARLKTVTLPSTVTILPAEVFAECESLSVLALPEGLREIRALAFRNCRKLRVIRLPDSVETIEAGAFPQGRGLLVKASPGFYGYRWAKKKGLKVQE